MKKMIVPSIYAVIGVLMLLTVSLSENWITQHPLSIPYSHLAVEIGIAIISAGLIGVLLETRHWSGYFSEKIREAVTGAKFLSKLTKEQIDSYRVNLYANIYGDQIRDTDSLYAFFNDKTLKELELTYREDYCIFITVKKVGSKLLYKEKISYRYRVLKKLTVPDIVKWSWDRDVLSNVTCTDINMYLPSGSGFSFRKEPGRLRKVENPDEYSFYGYDIPIDFRKDMLTVVLDLEYETKVGQIYGFSNNCPVKNIKEFKLEHPNDLIHNIVYFGVDGSNNEISETSDTINAKDTVFKLIYNDWCPTQYGFAFQVLEK